MKTEDVRFVTVSPESGKVFVALKNGKNVIRHFSGDDVRAANKTIREGGLAARVEFVVNLINTKYMKFEKPKPVPMCAADESFWLLHAKRRDCGLSPEDEKEYQYLLNEWNVF